MRPWQSWYRPAKRALDVAFALVLLAPTLIVLAVLSVGSLVFHGRPVFFTQSRVGRHGRPFTMVKLRTMTRAKGADRAYREGHRLTPYGRAIRRLRLDELPQILHVLTGAMSFVGPRPLMASHVAEVDGGGRRHQVRPGITCYAQLELARTGYLDKSDQVTLDERYVDEMSLWTDLRIIGQTLGTAMSMGGAE